MGATAKAAEYCLAGIDHWSTCLERNEWAAWAQAVFSVLAIIAAIWVARRAERKQEQNARNHEAAAIEKRIAILARAQDTEIPLVLEAQQMEKDGAVYDFDHWQNSPQISIIEHCAQILANTEMSAYITASELELINECVSTIRDFASEYKSEGRYERLSTINAVLASRIEILRRLAKMIRSGDPQAYDWLEAVQFEIFMRKTFN